jgi:hypothetical protein
MLGPAVQDVATEKVRYGRASLTIARSTPTFHFDDFDGLLAAYERGEAHATSVAAAFLRERVVDHTPSFDWRTATLLPLIRIVCEVSDDPKLEASTPTELADALVRVRASRGRRAGNAAARAQVAAKRGRRLFRLPLSPRAGKAPGLPPGTRAPSAS